MKILEFNIEKGIYRFNLDGIESDFHFHPAVEIIYAKSGNFSLETITANYPEVSFAMIQANVKHKIFAQHCDADLIMIECNSHFLNGLLTAYKMEWENGVCISIANENNRMLVEQLFELAQQKDFTISADSRVEKCLEYFRTKEADYKHMVSTLTKSVSLSESRLSHIFKQEVGISLKKYMVWSRLKKAFKLVVFDNKNLYEAALQSGFYDQAHLNKAFKQMLGISPSGPYNSRTVQE